jgi:hypothetical protein
MYSFRITKYNPVYRNDSGAYVRDDWTSYSDIGRTYAGKTLSLHEYQEVETTYIEVAARFLRDAGIRELAVRNFENSGKNQTSIKEGAVLTLEQLAHVMRAVLRQELWCRLEGQSSYVHFGWDFYMYVGVPVECRLAQTEAKQRGLFVESFISPYNQDAI